MKILFQNLVDRRFHFMIVEHNGKKFRIFLERTCLKTNISPDNNLYHSLSIMEENGNWKQIADAKTVKSKIRHDKVKDLDEDFKTLVKDFETYIIKNF